MTKARVFGIQIQPEIGDKKANLDKVQKLIEENAWFKPDLIVLPEVFNSGVDHKYLHMLSEKITAGVTALHCLLTAAIWGFHFRFAKGKQFHFSLILPKNMKQT